MSDSLFESAKERLFGSEARHILDIKFETGGKPVTKEMLARQVHICLDAIGR